MFEQLSANDRPEKLVPANFAAACIDMWANEGVPAPNAILGEEPRWIAQSELQPPSVETLLQNPDIKSVVEIADRLQSVRY